MELIDTPNPNAKKILTDLDESLLLDDLNNIEGCLLYTSDAADD